MLVFMNKYHLFIISLTAIVLPPVFNNAESATLGAHQHGSAVLNIAADGNVLFIEFESPAANIAGFEHEPQNAAQETAIESAIRVLENFESVFHLSPDAACKLDGASINRIAGTGEHAEFHAEYRLVCEQIERLQTIDVLLFNHFPGIEAIDVQTIFPGNQTAVELGPGQYSIKLK